MRNCIRIYGLSPLIALLACLATAGVPARADTSLTTPQNATNQYGQPVRATVSLKVKVDRVFVRLTNETSDLTDFDQTITGISFKLPTKPKSAHMGSSTATPRVVTPEGFKDSTPDDTRWNVLLDGDVVTLKAPGQRYSILPDARKKYPKADDSIFDPRHNPFLTKTVIMEVVFPDSGLTDQLTDIKIYWGHEPDILDRVGGLTEALSGLEPSDPPIEITGGTLPPGDTGGIIIPIGFTGGDGGGGGGGGGGSTTNDPGDPLPPPPTGGEIDPRQPTPPPDAPQLPPVTPDAPSTVPEPATLGMLAVGAAGLLVRRRK